MDDQVPKWHATKRSWPLELTDMSMVREPWMTIFFLLNHRAKGRNRVRVVRANQVVVSFCFRFKTLPTQKNLYKVGPKD